MALLSVSDVVYTFIMRKKARTHMPANVILHDYLMKIPEFVEFQKHLRGTGPSPTAMMHISRTLDPPIGGFLSDETRRTGVSYLELLRRYVMERPEYVAYMSRVSTPKRSTYKYKRVPPK
jgi:hypothetical protein